jgi:hypothetical protein
VATSPGAGTSGSPRRSCPVRRLLKSSRPWRPGVFSLRGNYPVSVAKPPHRARGAPKGRKENSPWREPGVSGVLTMSPEGAAQKTSGTRLLCRPFGARCLCYPTRGLTPGATCCRPFGPYNLQPAEFRDRNYL